MTQELTLSTITQNIEKQIKKGDVDGRQYTLLAASKTQSVEKIQHAINAGITTFGENKVQEAETKWPALKSQNPGVRLHLIGPLQSNKADQALDIFDVIQTLDRPKLAETLAKAMIKKQKRPDCYIQINTGKESQKSGIMPEAADEFIIYCRDELTLPISGLMCIPPVNQPPAPHFAYLKQLADKHQLSELSMGMSNDYLEALRMGATCIRLGRALFGARKE